MGSGSLDSKPQPLRTAVVGLGRMGRFHLEALGSVASIDVVALVEPSPAASGAAQVACPAASAYADLATALAHHGLEACLIASPTPLHPEMVGAALDAGLHVLCEKPLALDIGEAAQLGRRASEAGRVLQVGFWRRFAPPWTAAKLAIERGDIGTPRYLRLCQWDADPPPPAFCAPEVSGGLAIDCGVHEYDLAEWLTGRHVVGVRAWSLPIVDEAIAEAGDVDNLLAVLELDDGAVATVDLSRNARYADDVRTEVLGSSGAVFVDQVPQGRARLGDGSGMRELPGSTSEDVMAAGVAAQATAFAAAVRGVAVEVPDAAASQRATRIGHAVIEAAASGERIEVGS